MSSKTLNVVYISPHVDGYGADKSLLCNVIQLKTLGIKPIFIVPKVGPLTKELERNEIPYYVTGYRTWTKGKSSSRLLLGAKAILKLSINLALAFKMCRLLQKNRIDIVHTNDLVTNYGLLLAKMLRVQHITHSRCLLHESNICFDFGTKRTLKFLDNNTAAVIFNSHTVRDYYHSLLKKSFTCIIHSAIFRKSFLKTPLRQEKEATDPINFLFVGRYEKQKDPFTILKAVKFLRDAGLTNFSVSFFGKKDAFAKDYLANMEAFVDKCNLSSHVQLNGFEKDMASMISLFDAGLFTSPMEGIARVIIEYMMNGLPVIGANAGAVSSIIKEAYNGLLYEPENAADLAGKMRLLIENREKVAILGLNAYQSVGENFSAEYTSEKIMEVYQFILKKKRFITTESALYESCVV